VHLISTVSCLDKASSEGNLITPWFKLICDKFLYNWWNNLKSLQSQQDRGTIHRLWPILPVLVTFSTCTRRIKSSY